MADDPVVNALVGAALALVLTFLTPPVAVVVGGGAAGYLQGESGWSGGRVGALAGVFAAVPYVIAGVLLGSFIWAQSLGLDAGLFSVIGVGLFLGGFVVIGGFAAVLGAVGGAIGMALAADRVSDRDPFG